MRPHARLLPTSVRNGARLAALAAFPFALAGCQLIEREARPAAGSTGSHEAVAPVARIEYGLVIHGGAGAILPENMTGQREAAYRATLQEALRAGHGVLEEGGEALDAVVAAIQIMEDSPLFNAGRGAVFTHDGRNALDAAIMDGARRRAGAVAGVEDVRSPIALARLVMDDSPHVMLAGRGAEAFAREHGIPSTPPEWFHTDRRWQQLQERLKQEDEESFGTVGAVALDREGRVAAGTSTGGMTNKRWDRIGDVPIIGAGTYAEADCGVSTTGWGEYFIRNVVAYDICARTRYLGVSLSTAAHTVIHDVLEAQEPGIGGAIALNGGGEVTWSLNSAGMYRGFIDQDGNVTVAIFRE